MTKLKALLAVVATLSLVSSKAPASADPVKNIVLVHGAWVDASGWKPVYEILTRQGFHVTMVQEPETSFADDVDGSQAHPRPSGRPHAARRPQLWRLDHHRGRRPSERRRPRLCRRARSRRRRGRGRARQEDAERACQDRWCDQEDAGRLHLSRSRRSFPSCSRPICRASRQSSRRGRRC